MPGSSPTMARREPTRRLNSVDLPTLGRPTMARMGACGELEDEVKIIRDRVEAGALTCLAARRAGVFRQCLLRRYASYRASLECGLGLRPGGRCGHPPLHDLFDLSAARNDQRRRCDDFRVAAIIETLCP